MGKGGHDHYIARCHLRGFSPDGTHLWQLDLTSSRAQRVSVADAAVERDLNTIVLRGRTDRRLEKFMSEIESDVAPLLDRFRGAPTGGIALAAADNEALSLYLALAYARSPQWREGLSARSAEAMRAVADELEKDPSLLIARVTAAGGTYGPAEAQKVQDWVSKLRRGEVPSEIDVPQWLMSVDVATRKATTAIELMTKFVVRSNGGQSFVLGDCPVVLMRDRAYYHASGLGLTSEGVRVVVPISADSVLVASFATKARATELMAFWQATPMAMFINRASLEHAARFAFGRSERELATALRSYERNPLRN